MAVKLNITIDQGSDFSVNLDLTNETTEQPIDLTGYTGRAQFRKSVYSTNSTSFGVNLGGNTGVLTLSLPAASSSNVYPGRYLYDIEIVSPSNTVTRVVEGIVTITPEITK